MTNLLLLLKTDLIRTFAINKLKKANKLKTIAAIFVVIIIAIYAFFVMGTYTYLGIKYLRNYGLQQYVLPLVYFFGSFTIFYTTIYRAKSYLFNNDETLFAMPIKSSTILASRVITLICLSYVISAVVFIPAAVTYGVMFNLEIQYYIFAFLGLLFMPFVPNVLGGLFGYLIGYLTSKMGNKKIFESILTYLVVLLIMYISFNIPNIASKFVNNVDVVNKVLNNIGFLINSFMKMVIQYSIKDSIIYALTNIAAVAIFVAIFQSSYVKILQNLKVERTKSKFIEKEHTNKGIIATLLAKEFKMYVSIPIYILNTSFGVILIFLGSVATLFYDKDAIFKMVQFGDGSLPIYAYVIAIIAFCAALSNTAACSISIEGKNFWILKTLPIETKDIYISKILLNILVVIPLAFISTILFSISFNLSALQVIIITLLAILINVACSMFGILINLKFPRLDFTSYTQVVKQSLSSFIGIMVPLFVFMISIVAYTALNISIDTYILIIFTLLLIAVMVQYYILKTWGIKRFKEIN